ncbi:hypothetical protein [Metabacillus schmidteae]|uniref:hypothetical protein n=1 Tax=Metabacillus schmidteae TaxID=2730405 RepID=UPI00158F26DF|nr:hypothetical protein [Metabacillus schmidteae]
MKNIPANKGSLLVDVFSNLIADLVVHNTDVYKNLIDDWGGERCFYDDPTYLSEEDLEDYLFELELEDTQEELLNDPLYRKQKEAEEEVLLELRAME